MKLRFSRSTLNLIIFTCIILIGWASIDKNRQKDNLNSAFPLRQSYAEIELKPLDSLNLQAWTSQEGVSVAWQSRLDTDFLIRVRAKRANSLPSIDNNHINWQPNYWQWEINLGSDLEAGLLQLHEQLQKFPAALKNQQGSIVLQGPWSATMARLTSARIIKDLSLLELTDLGSDQQNKTHYCPWQPVTAQFWLQDQLTKPSLSQPHMDKKAWGVDQLPEFSDITASSLESWKQVFIQQWQADWIKPKMQFDMLSDLAYYRLPANYLLQGYWQVNELTPAVLEEYLTQCRRDVR
jgi:hypothetical protein